MRSLVNFAAIALASMAVSAPISVGPQGDDDLDFFPRPHRGKGKNNRRGKGKRSPPKKRSNRILISKRVRRKHRRAA